ncbi:mio [Drosophila busckii]|uniref:Mio n=1 Tax=Drosophila busckii TaxID=30019 RepID=A0A0M3QUA6_DROBS|nr:mio [Drosophila busckii]
MSGNIHGISWFPNFPNKFVSWGQEINLYEVRSKNKDEAPVTTTTTPEQPSRLPYIAVNYLANETRYQYARCVAASYNSEQPIIAVGLADGKIGICNFRDSYDSSWEYTPRQQRMSTCLAWNEQDAQLLAMGHDKHRNDYCITIWDIEQGVPKVDANFFGLGEAANSLCWDHHHRMLIAGMSQKLIKLFDLRQSNASCQSIQTKTVQGLSVAPNGNYLCSYVDSLIMLWDLRALERPLRQIQSSRNHLQIGWCPSRSALLSSVQRESPYITLYDIRCVETCANSREVYHVKRQISPIPSQLHFNAVHCLAWHPRDVERALLVADAANILDFRLPVSLLTAYNNRSKLPLLLQRPLQETSTNNADNALSLDYLERELLEDDLLEQTRQRALQNYGLQRKASEPQPQLSAYLRNVWHTLGNVHSEGRLLGLKSTLGIQLGHTSEALMASARIETQLLQWPDGINNSSKLLSYRSEQRDVALQLCGWCSDANLDRFIDELYARQEFSRAAMICVFHLKLLAACNILSRAADKVRDPSMYRITAIALSSFNADRCSSAWRQQRSSANLQIQDAHLRAIFSFLTMEQDNFEPVLKEEGISLADRAYMDASSDVQTVALVAINYFRKEHFQDNRIQYWIASYLDYLNSWGLWEKRAELDIKLEQIRASARSSRTVYLACNFCGKSVSNALLDEPRPRSTTTSTNRLSSCPSCRKPLPRCALCLMHMGTMMHSSSDANAAAQTKPFSKWFSWCQTCRHGGHTEHIMQWFKQNSECPVSSCNCRCFDLDNSLRDIS